VNFCDIRKRNAKHLRRPRPVEQLNMDDLFYIIIFKSLLDVQLQPGTTTRTVILSVHNELRWPEPSISCLLILSAEIYQY
jgi:hypothetical protein